MPITHRSRQAWFRALGLTLVLCVGAAPVTKAATRAAVAIVTATRWSPNDPARDGAQEFTVLLSLATLQQDHPLAGLVGVADEQGSFQNGEERAFRFAALNGVPVVKIAANGHVAHCPDELFIEAGSLPAAEACRLLASALERCGAPPRAQNPVAPTPEELTAITRHVQRLREEIALNRDDKLTQN